VDLIITGVVIFAFLIVVLSLIDLRLSIAFYISYLILVPYMQFKIAGFSLSFNLVNTLLLAVFIFQSQVNKRFKLNFQFISPFLFLYFSLLFLSLFTRIMPWSIQFNSWRASFMQTCFVSFTVWNLTIADRKFLVFFKWALIISLTISGIYGLFLMKMEGLNPYISILTDYFGKEDFSILYSELEIRLDFLTASKIQSTMGHPMTWCLMLCISIIMISAIYIETKNKALWIFIGLIAFNILISGVRTGIAALTIGFIYFLIRHRNFKLLLVSIIALILVAFIIQSNENLTNLFASFTDISGNKSVVSGSSITMRFEQLQGTINEIRGNELVGKGYGWTDYYFSLNGNHPVILAFESLLFMVLCNSGYLGLLVWILFFILLYQLNRKILTLKTNIYLMDTFIIVYALYSTITGEYGYMPFFAIFYSFLLGYFKSHQQSEIDKKRNWVTRNNKSYIQFEKSN